MKKRFLVVDVVVIFIGIVIFVGWLVIKNVLFPVVPPKKILTPIVNKLPYAINGLSGSIDHISGNTIYLSVRSSEQNVKPAMYLVHTTEKTNMTFSTPPVRYLLRTPVVVTGQVHITNLLPGQYITVTTSTDIRSIESNEVDAVSIAIISLNEILGSISNISNGNVITIVAAPPMPSFAFQTIPTPAHKEQYLITVTENTEISRYKATETNVLNAEKIEFSYLKRGMLVRVFTDTDLTFTRTGQALRIEPLY